MESSWDFHRICENFWVMWDARVSFLRSSNSEHRNKIISTVSKVMWKLGIKWKSFQRKKWTKNLHSWDQREGIIKILVHSSEQYILFMFLRKSDDLRARLAKKFCKLGKEGWLRKMTVLYQWPSIILGYLFDEFYFLLL